MLTRYGLVVFLVASVCACGGDGSSPSTRESVDAAPDARLGTGMCRGGVGPRGGCETAVNSLSECPSWQTICQGVCGAAYDCCYCGQEDGMGEWKWMDLYIDCPSCPDPSRDASSNDANAHP